MFSSEEDLLVCLGIQEPDVTVSIIQEFKQLDKESVKKPAIKQVPTFKKPSTVIVMLPIGLPGMGKTIFYENQLQQNIKKKYPESSLHIVSNDNIRKECV